MKKKLSLFSCMIAICFMFNSTVSAQTYGGGSGTSSDPYLISTAAHLTELATNTNNGSFPTSGKHYKMTNDINLTGMWTPIGSSSSLRFEGTFDGDGHSISGMNVTNTGNMVYGLFGYVNDNGKIRNVTIESNCTINADLCSGGVAGFSYGTIENCVNYANVTSYSYSGGIVGGNYGSVRNCMNHGSVSVYGSNGCNAGGIAGTNTRGIIECCGNTGSISASAFNAGGVTGDINKGTMTNCYNRGNVSAPTQVGGLIGQLRSDEGPVSIKNCYNASYVDGSQQTGAVFGSVLTTDVEYAALYFDSQLYSNAIGQSEFSLDEAAMTKTTSEMQSQAFIDNYLGTGVGEGKWMLDTQNINGGYPVFNNGTATPTYTITATAMPTNGGTVTGAGTYDEGETVTLTATANENYIFVNWTENGTEVSTDATYSFEATADRNLVANFEFEVVTSYTITATAEPTDGGTIEGAGTYNEGETVTLTATANEDYEFVNWTENGEEVSTDATYSFEATADRDLVANFTYLSVNETSVINVNIYPNPASDYISIEGEDIQDVTIYDISGRTLMTVEFRNNVQNINISDLNSGVYFLNIRTQEGSMIERIVKM